MPSTKLVAIGIINMKCQNPKCTNEAKKVYCSTQCQRKVFGERQYRIAAVSRIKDEIRKKENEKLVADYKAGASLNEISRMYRLSFDIIEGILDKYGIEIKKQ